MKPETVILRRAPAPIEAPYRDVLVPVDQKAADMIAKLPLGEDAVVTIKRDRSLPQHRLFWSVLQHVAHASKWENPDRLLIALKIRLGRYDLMQLPNGKVVPVPQSISFAAMSQDGFQEFMDASIRVICEEVVPSMDSAKLIAEAQGMIGGDTGQIAEQRR